MAWVEKRSTPFTQKLSWFMAVVAATGGAFVILNPTIELKLSWVSITFGGGFSDELKGAVVALILIEGWKAIKEYWLGTSASGNKQQESMSKIAEQVVPAAVAAVKTDTESQLPNGKGDK